MRQGRHQALRYLTGTRPTGRAGRKLRDQGAQLPGRDVPWQLREPCRLLPRVDVPARKRRQDAERHSVSLLADRGAKKLVELVFEEKHRMDIRHFISPRSTAQWTRRRATPGLSPDLSTFKPSRARGLASDSETTQSGLKSRGHLSHKWHSSPANRQ